IDTNRIRNNHGTSRIPCGLKIRRKTVNQTLSRPFAHAVRSGDNIGTAGADSAERPVLDVPADPALRHEAGPQGDVFDTFQRIWTRDHVWPQLRVNHA
ncbi:MAG: hypothetical protein KIC38_09120, partial [Actinomycetaceae bacterium]|nr:hypothetical protein [Actinomycetaceae bacterium]